MSDIKQTTESSFHISVTIQARSPLKRSQ